MSGLSVQQALKQAERRFAVQSDSFGLDAQVLLAHILGKERSWILAHPEAELSEAQGQAWEKGVKRVEGGEALPYVLGEWEFYGLKFKVTPAVLIPRPETELLVGMALKWLAIHPNCRRAVDVGSGSGCIAVALAAIMPDLHVVAGDISPAALDVARTNVKLHNLGERVQVIQSDLVAGMPGPFDVICANLPYIPSGRLPELEVSKREPWLALDGGADGLSMIRPFLQQAAEKLAAGGLLLAEIDASLEQDVISLAKGHWPHAKVEVRKDLTDLPRLLLVDQG